MGEGMSYTQELTRNYAAVRARLMNAPRPVKVKVTREPVQIEPEQAPQPISFILQTPWFLGALYSTRTVSDVEPKPRRIPAVAAIQAAVCAEFKISKIDICSSRRARWIARPRQIAMYLAKTLTGRSLPEIGRMFGGRDHTTVLHAVRKIKHLCEIDGDVACVVEKLTQQLEPPDARRHA